MNLTEIQNLMLNVVKNNEKKKTLKLDISNIEIENY